MKTTCYSLVLFMIVAFCAGCGAGYGKGLWKKAPMPANGSFDGVYQSDFGRMELTISGEHVVGLFEDDLHYGRVEGKIDGNLLRFEWTQWSEEMQGKTRESSGRGVFQYIVDDVPTTDKSKEYHRLEGWYGYEDDKLVNRWNASKMSSRVKKRLQQKTPSGAEESAEESYHPSVGFDENQKAEEKEPESATEPAESRVAPEVQPKTAGEDDLF